MPSMLMNSSKKILCCTRHSSSELGSALICKRILHSSLFSLHFIAL